MASSLAASLQDCSLPLATGGRGVGKAPAMQLMPRISMCFNCGLDLHGGVPRTCGCQVFCAQAVNDRTLTNS